ncbi:permease [Fusobacterium ulcerans]|uniref:permease n=1 Tax=Fusobacterium ulcerans TaxID=861 RepID=UPI000E53A590|nr:permease [Fusobacterium ulcerans]RGY61308.1 permease [Fusobacterium ulcerans]
MSIIIAIWSFFEDQFLKMLWLDNLVKKGLTALGIDADSRIGGSIQFFIYDTIKIIVLLSILIFVISYIQSFFPPERTKKILGNFKGIKANILSALLGTVTPFCSCSSIPIFIGFTNAGLPVGVTFSFLISSPLVDLGSFILLISVFGLPIAAIYVIVGLVLAVIGGTILDKMGMEKYVVKFTKPAGSIDIESPELTTKERLEYAHEQVKETVKKVFWYVIVGVGIGALIHNWIPAGIIQKILGTNNPFSVLIATFVGIPMYADIFGTIPIAEALFAKGVGVGTILSFMMGVTALSLPSIIMLKKVVQNKLLVTFVGIVAVGIIIIGYSFNAFGYLFI